MHAGIAVVAGERDHVFVSWRGAEHFLRLGGLFDGPDLVAQIGGALELQVLCRRLHALGQVAHDSRLLAFEEQHHIADRLAIVAAVGQPRAGRKAAVHIILQAGARHLAVNGQVAGAVGKQAIEQVEGGLRGSGVGEWAEIAAAVFDQAARIHNARPLLLHGDADIGIGLVVFEPHIIMRFVLFDELVFEDQGFEFGVGQDVLKVFDMADHAGHFGRGPAQAAEIRAHAVSQIDRLADIDDRARLVVHDIHARCGRHIVEALLKAALAVLLVLGHGLFSVKIGRPLRVALVVEKAGDLDCRHTRYGKFRQAI